MRILSALCIVLAMTVGASAQSATPRHQGISPGVYSERAGDSNWVPPTIGLSGPREAAAVPLQGINSLGERIVTQGVAQPPPPEPAKAKTATWKWADLQVCRTTCTAYGCDANQWQTCEGEGCTMQGRGCYAVWTGQFGQFSRQPGTIAEEGCYSMITTPNPMLCMR